MHSFIQSIGCIHHLLYEEDTLPTPRGAPSTIRVISLSSPQAFIREAPGGQGDTSHIVLSGLEFELRPLKTLRLLA